MGADVTISEYLPQRGLPSADYCSHETFALECAQIFFRQWICVGREQCLPSAGSFITPEVGGESLLITRGISGELHGFYNVCRHRGSLLCEGSGRVSRFIRCPYHGWAYGLDGHLAGTPHVHEDEGFDRADYPLLPVHVDAWAGFLFVNLDQDPPPLLDALRHDPEEPLQFERYGMGDLRTAHSITYEVAANWKIVIDNYNECLHCPTVHPELTALVPVYRQGRVEEDGSSWGVHLTPGATSFTRTGRSSLPPLPGITAEDRQSYYGCHLFPTMLLNFNSDCVRTSLLIPRRPDHTTIVSEFLVPEEVMGHSDLDLSDIIAFGDLTARQDYEVCERVQRGVRSRAFTAAIHPSPDRLLSAFKERYLSVRDGSAHREGVDRRRDTGDGGTPGRRIG
jgi:Rieske 2Fe-2S family protein